MMKRTLKQKRLIGLFTLSILACVACSHNSEEASVEGAPKDEATQTTHKAKDSPALKNGKVLAKVDDKNIYESDISPSIRLQSFDLAWAKYELVRAALSNHLAELLKERADNKTRADVHVLIEPPMPPRLNQFDPYSTTYVTRSQPSIGVHQAPVEVSVFCNYQSIHCARMAKTYAHLEGLYKGKLKFVYFDFPQKFHRYSAVSAQAARCADQNNQLANYQSALWASQNELKLPRLLQLAEQLGMNGPEFEACMNQSSVMQQIKENVSMANAMGLNGVPVTLINGLYLNGPKSIDDLRYYIDTELERTRGNVADKRKHPKGELKQATREQADIPESQLALRLEEVRIIGAENTVDSGESWAVIRQLDSQSFHSFNEDDEIIDEVYLVLIKPSQVVILNKGRLEFLPLVMQKSIVNPDDTGSQVGEGSTPDVSPVGDVPTINESVSKYQKIPEDVMSQDLEYKARPIVASTGVLPLSKEWVEEQLLQQSALQSGFKQAAHEVEGKHLLKLRGIQNSEFYQTLGLKEGDAVMRVNGEWVHEQHNNLFEVLESEDHLSIVLMRKGLPVHLEYAIH